MNSAVIAYQVGSVDSSYIVSASSYVGYIYLTNGVMPNPYSSLPPFFTSLIAALEPRATTANLLVQSVRQGGTEVDGLWTVIQSASGAVVGTGTTPLTFVGTSGSSYTVTVSNYGTYTFDHWENGAKNPVRTVTLTSDTTMTSSYKTSQSLTVQSVSLTGTPIAGLWTVVSSSSTNDALTSGFTPMTVSGTPGMQYSVSISNYGIYVFDHWENGAKNPVRTVTLTSDTAVTAYYRTSQSLTVQSVDLNGAPITGLWTVIYSSTGDTVASGFTPLTFSGTAGSVYTASLSNYQNYVLAYWDDGTNGNVRSTQLSQDTVLTAYYST
jgi:hypothetical protein